MLMNNQSETSLLHQLPTDSLTMQAQKLSDPPAIKQQDFFTSTTSFGSSGVLDEEEASQKSGATSEDDGSKPKRPLSAYNFFFQDERKKLLANRPVRAEGKPRRSHGKMGFADMARTVADKWNNLCSEERVVYENRARKEKLRYKKELAIWKKKQTKNRRGSKAQQQNYPSKSNAARRSSTLSDTDATISSLMEPQQQGGSPAFLPPPLQSVPESSRPLRAEESNRLTVNIGRLAHVMKDECIDLFLDIFASQQQLQQRQQQAVQSSAGSMIASMESLPEQW